MNLTDSKNSNFLIMVILCMMCSFSQVLAQQKVKVLTKTIHREIEYKSQELEIKGEKSKINIIGNESKVIKIEIKLISKNSDEKRARKELDIIKYDIKELTGAVVLSNYFESDEYQNITSNLSIVYNIHVPFNCRVNITNIYGNILVSQLNSSLKVKCSFGEMKMENIRGKIDLDLKYIDLYADKINAELLCRADKTDLNFKELAGTLEFQTNYGKINIYSSSGKNNIKIDATRTEVVLKLPEYLNYNYLLTTRSSEIFVPEALKGKYESDKQLKTYSSQMHGEKNKIIINTTYCPITIKRF